MIYGCYILQSASGTVGDVRSMSRNELEAAITSMRVRIDAEMQELTPIMYGYFASLLLEHGNRYHEHGGLYRSEVATYYRKAISDGFGRNIHRGLRFEWHIALARVLATEGDFAEAVELANNATLLAKDAKQLSLANCVKADTILFQGFPVQALPFYREALRVYPIDISLYQPIAICHVESQNMTVVGWNRVKKEIMESVNTITSDSKLIKDSQSLFGPGAVSYALHLISEGLQDYRAAWEYLVKANKVSVDIVRARETVTRLRTIADSVIRVFNKEFISSIQLTHASSASPIFIVGLPRSGSTLLESILFSHSEIFTIGEESILTTYLDRFVDDIIEKHVESKAFQREDDDDERDEGEDNDSTESEMLNFYDSFVQGVMYLSENKKLKDLLTVHTGNILNEMVEASNVYASKTSKAHRKVRHNNRILDKYLNNFLNIGFIHLLFPNAVIIHTTRNPLDIIFSCFKQRFQNSKLHWTHDLDTMFDGYKIYFDVMQHFRDLLPNTIYDLKHEDLVAEPEKTIRRLLERIDVHWEPTVLEHHSINRSIQTSSYLQVKRSINSSFIGKSKNYYPGLKVIAEKLQKLIQYPSKSIRGSDL